MQGLAVTSQRKESAIAIREKQEYASYFESPSINRLKNTEAGLSEIESTLLKCIASTKIINRTNAVTDESPAAQSQLLRLLTKTVCMFPDLHIAELGQAFFKGSAGFYGEFVVFTPERLQVWIKSWLAENARVESRKEYQKRLAEEAEKEREEWRSSFLQKWAEYEQEPLSELLTKYDQKQLLENAISFLSLSKSGSEETALSHFAQEIAAAKLYDFLTEEGVMPIPSNEEKVELYQMILSNLTKKKSPTGSFVPARSNTKNNHENTAKAKAKRLLLERWEGQLESIERSRIKSLLFEKWWGCLFSYEKQLLGFAEEHSFSRAQIASATNEIITEVRKILVADKTLNPFYKALQEELCKAHTQV